MKKALCVGINYYSVPQNTLNGCIDDVINMKNMLIDAYGYQNQNITVLRDDIINTPLLLPTKQNILNNLNTLVNNSANCDEIWFHYSGHGGLIQMSPTQTDSFIVPVDFKTAGYILDNDLHSIIMKAKCKFVIFIDSCNSGSVCELPYAFQYQTPTSYTKNTLYSALPNTNIYMMSGCKTAQTSVDTYDYEYRDYAGAFTDAILHCLRNANHNISILSLYQSICTYLAVNGFTQVPTLSSSNSTPNYSFSRYVPAVTAPVVSSSANIKGLILS
jgi:hypothetical protein